MLILLGGQVKQKMIYRSLFVMNRCLSLAPSELGGDNRGRKISILSTIAALGALGQHSSSLHARMPMEVLVFSSKPVRPCILLRHCSYLSTTKVAKVHGFTTFVSC